MWVKITILTWSKGYQRVGNPEQIRQILPSTLLVVDSGGGSAGWTSNYFCVFKRPEVDLQA